MTMKISSVELTPVSVPFHEPETWLWGQRRGISNVIVQLHTDNGLIGLGEAVGFPSTQVVLVALAEMVPLLKGRDPHHVERITRLLYARRGWHHYRHVGNGAIAGVEMALWDLIAKTTGQPVVNLLGGPLTETVPFYYHIPSKRLEAMAEEAKRALAQGITTLYLKIGFGEETDIAMVAAVREAGGKGVKVRVDANEAWTPAEAIHIIRQLEPFDIEFIEQPVSMYDVDALARVRAASAIPIAANQTSWTEFNVLDIIRRQAADVILTDQHQVGGLLAFKKVCALCEYAQLPVLKHSFGDLGISTAAALHILSSCPNTTTMASQTHLHFVQHDIVRPAHTFTRGALPVPQAPGLGVELDLERMAEAHERYQREGEYSPYGEPGPTS
jgi:L-alanine-DL-glutamate epimerase-like enolase superfamily enzyme